jgi:hypothetical protein
MGSFAFILFGFLFCGKYCSYCSLAKRKADLIARAIKYEMKRSMGSFVFIFLDFYFV